MSASTDETDLWSDLEARIEPADVGADVFFGAAPSGLEQYRIGPEDLLEIGVFEADQLNRTVRVEADGNVTLPLDRLGERSGAQCAAGVGTGGGEAPAGIFG